MLTPADIALLVTATKGAVDLFDKLAGPIKKLLLPPQQYVQNDASDQRWRFKVGAEGSDIVVKQDGIVRQTLKGEDLAKKLGPKELALVQTYERKMEDDFELWSKVYASKDASQDPLVNAKTDLQLKKLIASMRGELLGILSFLEQIGVHLDDHYMHVRSLIQQV